MSMRQIIITPYETSWPAMFEKERSLIKSLLDGVAKDIHHIGSTSIPGLAAKPIIDMLIEVSDLDKLESYNPVMTRAGYISRGENGIPRRRYFIKGVAKRSYHVHAFVIGDEQVLRHLAFRDYLRRNRDAAKEYAEIKYSAASLGNRDPQRYSDLKAKFIEYHLRLALGG